MDAGEKLLAAIEKLTATVERLEERLPPLTPAQRMARMRERKKAEEAARYAETASPVTQVSEGNVTQKVRNAVTQPPSLLDGSLPSPAPQPSLLYPPSPLKSTLSSAVAPDVERVFSEWQRAFGKSAAKLTRKRAQNVKARLSEGYSADRLISAIHGCKRSPFHQGQNDRGVKFNDLELICRSGEQVEKFEELCPRAPPAAAAKPKTAQEIEAEASAEFEREWRAKHG